jgi:hypothetical protein
MRLRRTPRPTPLPLPVRASKQLGSTSFGLTYGSNVHVLWMQLLAHPTQSMRGARIPFSCRGPSNLSLPRPMHAGPGGLPCLSHALPHTRCRLTPAVGTALQGRPRCHRRCARTAHHRTLCPKPRHLLRTRAICDVPACHRLCAFKAVASRGCAASLGTSRIALRRSARGPAAAARCTPSVRALCRRVVVSVEAAQ